MFKLGLSSGARAMPRVSQIPRVYRSITTKTTITDHVNGKVIKLTDPDHPEMADYPNPKPMLAQNKSPYVKYDDQQNRRNLNDPVNFNDDLYDMWSPDYFQHVKDSTAVKHNLIFFGLIFSFGATIYLFELNPEKPAMTRSFPFNGLAKELGSGSDEDAPFYRVKPDTTAEQELGFLATDPEIESQKKAYLAANADYVTA